MKPLSKATVVTAAVLLYAVPILFWLRHKYPPQPEVAIEPIPTSLPGLVTASAQAHAQGGWNCGEINLSSARQPRIANACVVKAMRTKTPFRIKLDLSGNRELTYVYLMGDKNGRIFLRRVIDNGNSLACYEKAVMNSRILTIEGKQSLVWDDQRADFYGYKPEVLLPK